MQKTINNISVLCSQYGDRTSISRTEGDTTLTMYLNSLDEVRDLHYILGEVLREETERVEKNRMLELQHIAHNHTTELERILREAN